MPQVAIGRFLYEMPAVLAQSLVDDGRDERLVFQGVPEDRQQHPSRQSARVIARATIVVHGPPEGLEACS
jgi:hypothetical protein